QTSNDGETWTDVADVPESTCATDIVPLAETGPVTYVRMQGVERASTYGYSLFTFSLFAMDPLEVTPAAPEFTDSGGTDSDTYTIPATEGVEYLVSGDVVAAGTYPASGTVVVTARAAGGYVFAEEAVTEWSHTFDATDPTDPDATAD